MQQIPLYVQLVAERFSAVGDLLATAGTMVFCGRRKFFEVFSSRMKAMKEQGWRVAERIGVVQHFKANLMYFIEKYNL